MRAGLTLFLTAALVGAGLQPSGAADEPASPAQIKEWVRGLGGIGEDAGQAVPALLPLLKDKEEEVRARAARGLGAFGEEAKDAVADLIALLRDKDEDCRASAAKGLGGIGPEAKAAVSA